LPLLTRYTYGRTWSLVGSPTLVEDARAVLDGDADYPLGHDEPLAGIEGPYGMNQGILNDIASHVMYIPVVTQVSGPISKV
jgi:hypothetical protein